MRQHKTPSAKTVLQRCVSKAVEQRLDAWVAAKRRRDYATADAIRDELQQEGVSCEEAPARPPSPSSEPR